MGSTTALAVITVATLVVLGVVLVGTWLSGARRERRAAGLVQNLDESLRALASSIERTSVPAIGGSRPRPVTLDLEQVLGDVAADAAALPGVDAAAVRIRRVDGTFSQATRGLPSAATGLEVLPDPPGQGTWETMRLAWDRGPDVGGETLLGGVVVPVMHEGDRIGVLGAWSRSADGPGVAAISQLQALAASAASPIGAAREHQGIQELVRTDQLTGLLNRRGYDETLVRELARARRNKSPLTLLAIDLDHFRDANSVTHSHGDDLLRTFARVLVEACRSTDFPCRRGGDEFTIVLPDTGCIEGLRVDARIRSLASAAELDETARITYSSGVTELEDGDNAATIDERASALVNQVKREGRGGVRHDATPPAAH